MKSPRWLKWVPTPVVLLAASLSLFALWLLRSPSDSAYATAVATVALCVITAWYASLTQRLVGQNREQLAAIAHSQTEARWWEAVVLANLADRVGAGLRELPEAVGAVHFDRRIRMGALWVREDLRELERLSARLGPWAAGPLVHVVNYLIWMGARIAEVQSVHPSTGYDYTKFPGDQWALAWQKSSTQLMLVAKLARDEAERLRPPVKEAA